MKSILLATAAVLATAGSALALSADHDQITTCGFGDGLGPDLVCSIYVQAEFHGKAAYVAGFADADFRYAPEVRQSDLIGDNFLSRDGVIVIGVDGTQEDLYRLYGQWMVQQGHIDELPADYMSRFSPLGFDEDGSVLGPI